MELEVSHSAFSGVICVVLSNMLNETKSEFLTITIMWCASRFIPRTNSVSDFHK